MIKLILRKEEINKVNKETYTTSSYEGYREFRFKIIAKIYAYYKRKKGYEIEVYE